ncbi:MAG: DsbC family protein [Gammaproteobacteria bacterium]|nr:DsbC family protein [Rhodoferax sp.]MBU3900696.1 DsbC family protein [Gammaproteobacteria bacterium]MBU3998378.1 DsbC family protein [Gammaproteobacteria bacterium]MBU4081354.1 DsbC family protein [Gammaproteobacteria bacterium]MBU4112333.1 DsbC family protein [Gammaproteobacteria bacterium]
MKFHPLLSIVLLSIALGISGCSPQDSTKTAAASKREVSLPTIAAQAKGFSAGALMSSNTVYVFFDTQCSHCGHLWQASEPLQRKVKFVWIPIGMINASSKAQGAALLTAASPAALMTEHETSLLAGQGGIAASSSVNPEIEQSIKNNTQLFNSFGADAVPFIVAKNMKSGQTVSQAGAMTTVALAEFLGVDAP